MQIVLNPRGSVIKQQFVEDLTVYVRESKRIQIIDEETL